MLTRYSNQINQDCAQTALVFFVCHMDALRICQQRVYILIVKASLLKQRLAVHSLETLCGNKNNNTMFLNKIFKTKMKTKIIKMYMRYFIFHCDNKIAIPLY